VTARRMQGLLTLRVRVQCPATLKFIALHPKRSVAVGLRAPSIVDLSGADAK
jgi:hypothetical protein